MHKSLQNIIYFGVQSLRDGLRSRNERTPKVNRKKITNEVHTFNTFSHNNPFRPIRHLAIRPVLFPGRFATCHHRLHRQSTFFVETATGEVSKTIKLEQRPTGLNWRQNLWISDYSTGNIFQPESRTQINVAPKPLGIAVAAQSRLAVVCGYGTHEVSLVNLTNGKELKRLPANRHPYFVDISPDEKRAVVGNLLPATSALDPDAASTVTVIDLETREKLADIFLPYGSSNLRQVKISPNGRWAYAAHTRGRVNLPTN